MLQRILDWTANDFALKLTALVLAFLLWTTVRADTPGTWAAEDITVRVLNNDPDWVIAEAPNPRTVRVVFRGPYRELLRVAAERPDIIVPIDQVNDSVEVRRLLTSWVGLPAGTPNTDVVSGGIQPDMVRLAFDRVATRLIPIAVDLQGELAPGFELAGPPEIDPSVVRASGAGRNLARIDSLRLPPIDVREHRGTDTLELTIDTTGTGLVISPRTVRVILPIRPILTEEAGAPPMSLLSPLPRAAGTPPND